MQRKGVWGAVVDSASGQLRGSRSHEFDWAVDVLRFDVTLSFLDSPREAWDSCV